MTRAELIALTRKMYGSSDVEIDSGAKILPVEGGYWVGAWVWVPKEDRCTQCGGPLPDNEDERHVSPQTVDDGEEYCSEQCEELRFYALESAAGQAARVA